MRASPDHNKDLRSMVEDLSNYRSLRGTKVPNQYLFFAKCCTIDYTLKKVYQYHTKPLEQDRCHS